MLIYISTCTPKRCAGLRRSLLGVLQAAVAFDYGEFMIIGNYTADDSVGETSPSPSPSPNLPDFPRVDLHPTGRTTKRSSVAAHRGFVVSERVALRVGRTVVEPGVAGVERRRLVSILHAEDVAGKSRF